MTMAHDYPTLTAAPLPADPDPQPAGQDAQPGGHSLSPLREVQGGCSGERCDCSGPWLAFRCAWRANSRLSPAFGYREFCSRPSF